MQLRTPDLSALPGYLAALKTGWTPGSDGDIDAARQLIASVESDPERFVARLWNPTGQGAPVTLSDGREVPRLAHVRYWIFDDEYCGEVNLRWQPGTSELPPYCDGHVGYAVVPWKRCRGIASSALRSLAAIAPTFGLEWLDVAMSADNLASRRVAESSGARLIEEYVATEQGGVTACKYRLDCSEAGQRVSPRAA
jgi:predicted acetyltransferase